MLFCPLYEHRKWIAEEVDVCKVIREQVTEKRLKPSSLPPKSMFFPRFSLVFFLIHLHEHSRPCLGSRKWPFFSLFYFTLWKTADHSHVGDHSRRSIKGILDRCLTLCVRLAWASPTNVSSFDLSVSHVSVKLFWFWVLKKNKNIPKRHQQNHRKCREYAWE